MPESSGQHGAGARLALFGAGAATVGGYLGGHLAFASTNRDDTAAQVEPGSVVDAA